VALLPYQFETKNGFNFAPADCLMLLVLVLAPGRLKYRSLAWSPWHTMILAIFAVGSLVAALRLGGLDRYELMNKDAGLLLPFLTYAAITSAVDGWADVRVIVKVFVLGVGLQNLVMLGGYLLGYFFGVETPFADYNGMRLSGMLIDPNAYGGLLATTFVIAEGASQGSEPLFRGPVLWLLRATLGAALLFTFSRSAWIALGLGLLLLTVLRPRATVRLLAGAMLAAPLLLLALGRRFVPIFQEMASRPKQVQGRFDLIHDAFDAFNRHPLLGGGMGNFRLSEGRIAHNTAMWFLADFGIAGLVVLVGFLGWFFVRGWNGYRHAPAAEKGPALAALLGHTAMCGLAMGIEAFYQRQWWVALALVASCYRLATRQVAAPSIGFDPEGAATLRNRPVKSETENGPITPPTTYIEPDDLVPAGLGDGGT
jgi:O-antigen ligase